MGILPTIIRKKNLIAGLFKGCFRELLPAGGGGTKLASGTAVAVNQTVRVLT